MYRERMSVEEATQPSKRKVDYNGTSRCKNKLWHEKNIKCRADAKECLYYRLIKTKDGNMKGYCKLRYDKREQEKREQEKREQEKRADLKKTQEISNYNRRRS